MFTGLIEEIGSVLSIRATKRGVKSHRAENVTFDLLAETLARTNLKTLRRNSRVNLERALSANARLGGHFVQGHIDCTARVLTFEEIENDHRLEVELPSEFSHYVASKGSIAVNGISLTVAELLPSSFACWIIPHTRRLTNLGTAKPGDWVNLEFDILAKYVERVLPRGAVTP